MKIKVDSLIAKLNEARESYKKEIEEAKKAEVKRQKDDESLLLKYVEGMVEYHKAELKRFSKMKTYSDYFANEKENKAPAFPHNYLGTNNKVQNWEYYIKKITAMIGQLEMVADPTITIKESDDYFRYIDFGG